jgi:hypothetical protein
MDIKPEEKSYHCASSFDLEAINESNLSRVISPGTLGKMSSPTTNLVVHVNSENVTRLNHGMPFGYLK